MHSCICSYIHSYIHLIHPIIAYAFMHSFIHSFIRSFIHSSHTSKHRICDCYITMFCVTSRSGSHLIRYERQLTEVRRPAHERLKAASGQTKLWEKNRDEPQRPCPTPLKSGQGHLDLSHSILTSSQTHRISIEERPMGHPSLLNGSGIC